jgi:hypothetical protein
MAEQKETIIEKGTENVKEDYVERCGHGCVDRSFKSHRPGKKRPSTSKAKAKAKSPD